MNLGAIFVFGKFGTSSLNWDVVNSWAQNRINNGIDVDE
uniref:Uncharacterized protein n=1 Tax=Loigolactobacillus rennini TaxID=238013 RepID=A0A1K2I5L2_9LACO|nr:hypothetical protein LREN565_0740 [Loigolactobacillus rennini]